MTLMTLFTGPSAKRSLEPELKRYAKAYRRRLRKLAKTSSRLGDLIFSYPAAAFALVSNYGPVGNRAQALQLVKEGASLKRVGTSLGLPNWFRSLPPEAFISDLPTQVNGDSEVEFGRRVVNSMPDEPERVAMWLAWVLEARVACDDAFALWVASRWPFAADGPPAEAMAPLAAFAWTSQHGEGAARAHIRTPWRRRMTVYSAVSETREWISRLLLRECAAEPVATGGGGWTQAERSSAFRLVPLRTPDDLFEEGRLMSHCVATYTTLVARGECLIYGVRRGGERVATLEIRGDPLKPGRGKIVQLLGPCNQEAPDEVWRAIEKWLSRKGGCPIAPRGRSGPPIDRDRWHRLWTPYFAAKGAHGALRPEPTERTAYELYSDLDRL
ncbi:MAG: PcfJ domain-containing protein [Rhodobacteraceae bacterium]|nr:PcfJ domain-containing protein [Paracoccaceae bacterium]